MRDFILKTMAGHEPAGIDMRRGDFDLNPSLKGKVTRKYTGRAASVLVPLVDRADDMTVLLTRRTEHLPDHAGQVAFPGGAREAGDKDAIDTALRETEEEIGIGRELVHIAGALDLYETSTGYHVAPIVGLVTPGFELAIDPHEVAEAFEVPLNFLLDPENHRIHSRVWLGRRRYFYAIPYGEHYIWGATAGMLMNLYELLTGNKPVRLDAVNAEAEAVRP